eukprot:13387547-Alexandrium_andersonii.AAC.1
MSASLVGSEMCIRDRLRRTAATAAPTRWSTGMSATFCRMPSVISFRPVSYTHLTLPTICSV